MEISFIDLFSLLVMMFLSAWKAKELVDIYAPKAADWIIKKIQGDK